MTPILVALLAVVGAAAVILPLRQTRFTGLSLGSRAFALTSPVDFSHPRVAIPSYVIGAICLAGALLLSGALDRLNREDPPTPDETALFDDRENGTVVVRLLQPNTMAASTVAADASDFTLEADMEVRSGPQDAVTCVVFRADGDEQQPARSYRPRGTDDWPERGYAYCISKAGAWALARYTGGQPEIVEDFRPFVGANTEGANRVGVRAAGNSFTLSINGVDLGTFDDDAYASGLLQLACGTPAGQEPTATCHFSRVELTPND